jgi:D-alanyl-lipoteichoic acid acyltransferase DltB (MBOAT superfamily)
MLFNSLQYLVFFPVVVCLYFLLPQRHRWMLLLAASWYFYACWKVKYLGLLFLTTTVDYTAARLIEGAGTLRGRRLLVLISLSMNLGLLFLFKYFNFVNDSLSAVFAHFNVFYESPTFKLLLPVGISFYTFQSISYVVDVYRGAQKAERHFGRFALYVSFFPQLVAGPIERSPHMLPQFQPERDPGFDRRRVLDGLGLILWGLVKKVVIADRLAYYVEATYSSVGSHTGLELLLATYLFAFQIYCDFSGYSDIAIGSARVMGFDLMTNFRMPYLATSIREFWQRWHISLSTWFRDYVYIPLGGNRHGRLALYRNLFLTFFLSGIWHGANWTFVLWGALHGTYLIVSLVTQSWRDRAVRVLRLDAVPGLLTTWRTLATFHLVLIGWVFFRANSLADAMTVFRKVGLLAGSLQPQLQGLATSTLWRPPDLAFIWAMVLAVLAYEYVHIARSGVRRGGFGSLVSVSIQFWMIVVFGMFNDKAFIYFQF